MRKYQDRIGHNQYLKAHKTSRNKSSQNSNQNSRTIFRRNLLKKHNSPNKNRDPLPLQLIKKSNKLNLK